MIMFIFTLLGRLLDIITLCDCDKIVIDTNNVSVDIDNMDIIDECIIPLCEDMVEERYNVIENGQWYIARLNFGMNKYCNRPELQSVTFINSFGDNVTCNIGDEILKVLSCRARDEIYFKICCEIFYEILS